MTYNQLMKIAMEVLPSIDAAPEWLPAPLIYVFETAGGNTYTVMNDDFQAALDALAQREDTAVTKILAVWKDGCVDIPSYAFRKALLALNAANAQAMILVLTEGGYVPRPLAVMM